MNDGSTPGRGAQRRAARVELAWVLRVFIFSICVTIWVPFALTVGGLNIRASQLLLPVVGLLLLLQLRATRVSIWSLAAVAGGAVWLLSLAFWTLVNTPEFGQPFARVALMGLNLLQAAAVYVLVVRVGEVRIALRALLVSVTLLNGLLLAVSLASSLGVPIPTTWLAPEMAPLLVDGELVSGTVQRFVGGGVLAGCMSAAAAVLAVSLWFDPQWRSRWLLGLAGTAAMVGMVIAFSRQSVLSLGLGLLVVVLFLARGGVVRLVKLASLGLLFAAVGLSALLATAPGRQAWSAFAGRAVQIVDADAYVTGTAAGRAAIWLGMAREIARNPFVGHGQDAYLRYMGRNEEGAHNFPIEVFHSTGLAGFAGYLALHAIAPLIAVWLLFRGGLPEHVAVPLVAVLGAYTSVVAASLTNIIYWNPTYWLMLALMIAVVRLVSRVPSHTRRRTANATCRER